MFEYRLPCYKNCSHIMLHFFTFWEFFKWIVKLEISFKNYIRRKTVKCKNEWNLFFTQPYLTRNQKKQDDEGSSFSYCGKHFCFKIINKKHIIKKINFQRIVFIWNIPKWIYVFIDILPLLSFVILNKLKPQLLL